MNMLDYRYIQGTYITLFLFKNPNVGMSEISRVKASVAVLKECSTGDLEKAKKIHAQAQDSGYDSNIHLASSLVTIYSKCGSLVDARRVFNNMQNHQRDVVLWTALILGHVDNGEVQLALDLFAQMQTQRCAPNTRTLVALFKGIAVMASSEIASLDDNGKPIKFQSLEKGMAIHSKAPAHINIYAANALINMYAKCGSMVDACKVLQSMVRRDVVSWNSMITGYIDNGEPQLALDAISHMGTEGCDPNTRTFILAMKACGDLAEDEEGHRVDKTLIKTASLQKSMFLYSKAVEAGYQSDTFLLSTLVDVYAKCGSMEDALYTFTHIPCPNVVAWTALIQGYADNGAPDQSLLFFMEMQYRDVEPNYRTFVSVTKAACAANMETHKLIHSSICRYGFETEQLLGNCMVDAYGKLGDVLLAQYVFNALPYTDTVSWTALISAYSFHGDTQSVFDMLEQMEEEETEANGVTFIPVLTACNHAGLVSKGKKVFESMQSKYNILPSEEHYLCMVDMLGRVNEVDIALDMVTSMRYEASYMVWMAILDASRKWKNVDVAKVAFEALLRIDDKDPAVYDLMASVFNS